MGNTIVNATTAALNKAKDVHSNMPRHFETTEDSMGLFEKINLVAMSIIFFSFIVGATFKFFKKARVSKVLPNSINALIQFSTLYNNIYILASIALLHTKYMPIYMSGIFYTFTAMKIARFAFMHRYTLFNALLKRHVVKYLSKTTQSNVLVEKLSFSFSDQFVTRSLELRNKKTRAPILKANGVQVIPSLKSFAQLFFSNICPCCFKPPKNITIERVTIEEISFFKKPDEHQKSETKLKETLQKISDSISEELQINFRKIEFKRAYSVTLEEIIVDDFSKGEAQKTKDFFASLREKIITAVYPKKKILGVF